MSHHSELTIERSGYTKSFKTYVTGFFLSLVLTSLAFILIAKHSMSDSMLYLTLTVLALLQFLVQSVCFLGLNLSRVGRWNLLPFLFTLLVIAILVSGSLWIMYNLNVNMTLGTNLTL